MHAETCTYIQILNALEAVPKKLINKYMSFDTNYKYTPYFCANIQKHGKDVLMAGSVILYRGFAICLFSSERAIIFTYLVKVLIHLAFFNKSMVTICEPIFIIHIHIICHLKRLLESNIYEKCDDCLCLQVLM